MKKNQKSEFSKKRTRANKNAPKTEEDRKIITGMEALLMKVTGGKEIGEMGFGAFEEGMLKEILYQVQTTAERQLKKEAANDRRVPSRCSCKSKARWAGSHRKSILTIFGDVTFPRPYTHCKPCSKGSFPTDVRLGIAGESLSPLMLQRIAHVGAIVSFEEGSRLIQKLSGIDLSAKQVERYAKILGEEVAKDDVDHVVPEDRSLTKTIYLGPDGTGLPVRKEEVKNRKGKQPDGSAKTREAKVLCIWTAEDRDKHGHPVRDEGSVTYSAAIESVASRDTDTTPSDFARRVQREALRRKVEETPTLVMLGDGAHWIGNLRDEFFPQAIQIVDLFHAKERLSLLSEILFPSQKEKSKEWAEERHEELWDGKIGDLLKAISIYSGRFKEAHQNKLYFEHHRSRMDYPTYRAMGLCIGSGVVEAGCKNTAGTRLKRPGMHWTVRGANSILALRCSYLNNRLDRFFERRIQRLSAEGFSGLFG